MKIAILGAGAMGSAIATPLLDAGHEVNLWGTHLDDHLIDAVRAGQPHPRTNVVVPAGVKAFKNTELAEAMKDIDAAVLAVASVGVEDITRLAAPYLKDAKAFLVTSKGFSTAPDGTVEMLPQAMERVLAESGVTNLPIVAVGGTCKANEVASRRPTASIFGHDGEAAQLAKLCSTDAYRAANTADRDGVELCAALKNCFAIALGVADGLGEQSVEQGGQPYHDLKSAIFAEAIAELRTILTAVGADPWTAAGLAGAGDLEVTGLSGRNKVFGTRLGKGQAPKTALAEMTALEQTVEGVSALPLAITFVTQRDNALLDQLPLLAALNRVVTDGASIDELTDAALPKP